MGSILKISKYIPAAEPIASTFNPTEDFKTGSELSTSQRKVSYETDYGRWNHAETVILKTFYGCLSKIPMKGRAFTFPALPRTRTIFLLLK